MNRQQQWLSENLEALKSSNDFVERHGVPLGRYRDAEAPATDAALAHEARELAEAALKDAAEKR